MVKKGTLMRIAYSTISKRMVLIMRTEGETGNFTLTNTTRWQLFIPCVYDQYLVFEAWLLTDGNHHIHKKFMLRHAQIATSTHKQNFPERITRPELIHFIS